jgi:uncharacterized membrane protein (UPF0127 family)
MVDKKLFSFLVVVFFILGFISFSRLYPFRERGITSQNSNDTSFTDPATPLVTPNPVTYATVEQTPDHGFTNLTVVTTTLRVEVVNTSASITQGLSGRSSIGSDGMLFVFTQSMMPRFWMKEMQFPLDLIWINNGKIVDITENVSAPEPGQALNDLPTFGPKEPANWVLEVPAGTAKSSNWKVGDVVGS